MPHILSAMSSPEYAKHVPVMIVCMFIGVVAAALISLYHKHVLGAFIRFLRASGAVDESTAIRLSDTKFNKNVFVRAAIRNGRTYSSVLRAVAPEDKGAVKSKRSERERVISESGYYIPEELSFRADNIFSKKGTTVLSAITGVLLFALVAAVSYVVVPQIIDIFKNFTGMQ